MHLLGAQIAATLAIVLLLPYHSAPFSLSTAPSFSKQASALRPTRPTTLAVAATISEECELETAAATFVNNYYPNPTAELTEMCSNRFKKDFGETRREATS